jgi:hypothetical protein
MKKNLLFGVSLLWLVLFLHSCKKDENNCSTNGYGSWAGYDVCYRVTAENYSTGVLASGDTTENLRLVVQGETRAPYSQIDLSSQAYSPPFEQIGRFKVNEEYYDRHAAPFIQNAVQFKNGTFKFTKIDRVARKVSGNCSYTYVENLSQGNVDRVVNVTFTDVSF